MMTETKCLPKQFQRRIIFMSMYNDIVWEKKGNKVLCITNPHKVTEYATRFASCHLSILGLGSEMKWHGTHSYKPNGGWDRVAEQSLINFSESGQHVLRGSSEGKGKHQFISTAMTKPSKQFFARLFSPISSVSTEPTEQ